MSDVTCDAHIAELAEWIDLVSAGKSGFNMVAMIATDEARVKAANTLMGEYRRKPELKKMFANFVDPTEMSDALRLSALREALGCLARGKYKAKVQTYVTSLPSREGFISTLSNIEGAVVAV
jgi:hypothetical protein